MRKACTAPELLWLLPAGSGYHLPVNLGASTIQIKSKIGLESKQNRKERQNTLLPADFSRYLAKTPEPRANNPGCVTHTLRQRSCGITVFTYLCGRLFLPLKHCYCCRGKKIGIKKKDGNFSTFPMQRRASRKRNICVTQVYHISLFSSPVRALPGFVGFVFFAIQIWRSLLVLISLLLYLLCNSFSKD